MKSCLSIVRDPVHFIVAVGIREIMAGTEQYDVRTVPTHILRHGGSAALMGPLLPFSQEIPKRGFHFLLKYPKHVNTQKL